jgi:iron(III) transport system ATP-binding protein
MAVLKIDGVTKRFGGTTAVDAVSLEARSGEFLALLGPSGCGKTTLLRLIAGFEKPDTGSIELDGEVVADYRVSVAPEHRNMGMVFQSYALWPHLSVHGNISYGLKVRKMPRAAIDRAVADALGLVGLDGLGERRPDQLSGGQRQRVALARCLALDPGIVLLDEPLANLDAHLRDTMRTELRRIQKETGSTFILVTHDQAEAMSMADRIAVMDRGRIVQVAAPTELYRSPGSTMVASFIGQGVVLPGTMRGSGDRDRATVEVWGKEIRARSADTGTRRLCEVCVRPPDLEIVRGAAEDSFESRVRWVSYEGRGYVVGVSPEADDSVELRIEVPSNPPGVGDSIRFRVIDSWVLPARPDVPGVLESQAG